MKRAWTKDTGTWTQIETRKYITFQQNCEYEVWCGLLKIWNPPDHWGKLCTIWTYAARWAVCSSLTPSPVGLVQRFDQKGSRKTENGGSSFSVMENHRPVSDCIPSTAMLKTQNMNTEIQATTSVPIWPQDKGMFKWNRQADFANIADEFKNQLGSPSSCHYEQLIEINLGSLKLHMPVTCFILRQKSVLWRRKVSFK